MVSFLHAADLHLGLRLTRFNADTVLKVREARFQALGNLLKLAAAEKVDFLLLAGDIFDDHAVEQEVARRCLQMLQTADRPVFVLPGNHDPLLPGGVWDRPPWQQLPTTGPIYLLRQAQPVTIQPGVVLYPCPLFRKTSLQDPTAWIAQEPRAPDTIRIGLAHGSLKVRDDLPADDHLIARPAAQTLGLDYLALGHWHSRQLFPDGAGHIRTAYPGVPEPMRFQGTTEARTGWTPYSSSSGNQQEFLDSGKGEVLLVRVEGPGSAPTLQAREVGHLAWHEEAHALSSDAMLAQLIAELAQRAHPERSLLRLKLSGVLPAEAMLRLCELQQILSGRYLLGELDAGSLHMQPSDSELRELAGQGILGRVLDKLLAESATSDPPTQARAERATLLLYQLAREVHG